MSRTSKRSKTKKDLHEKMKQAFEMLKNELSDSPGSYDELVNTLIKEGLLKKPPSRKR